MAKKMKIEENENGNGNNDTNDNEDEDGHIGSENATLNLQSGVQAEGVDVGATRMDPDYETNPETARSSRSRTDLGQKAVKTRLLNISEFDKNNRTKVHDNPLLYVDDNDYEYAEYVEDGDEVMVVRGKDTDGH